MKVIGTTILVQHDRLTAGEDERGRVDQGEYGQTSGVDGKMELQCMKILSERPSADPRGDPRKPTFREQIYDIT